MNTDKTDIRITAKTSRMLLRIPWGLKNPFVVKREALRMVLEDGYNEKDFHLALNQRYGEGGGIRTGRRAVPVRKHRKS